MRVFVSLLFVGTILAGCLSDDSGPEVDPDPLPSSVDYSHLGTGDAQVFDNFTTRTLQWEGSVGFGAAAPLIGAIGDPDVDVLDFEADGVVGYIEVTLQTTGGTAPVLAVLLDDTGAVSCATQTRGTMTRCTGLVPTNLTVSTYTIEVSQRRSPTNQDDVTTARNDASYQVTATLYPPFLIPRVDFTEGLSQAANFTNFDTGFRGGEPTIGLTSDGTIFAVEGDRTIRSRDDGATWQDVTPPLTTVTLDPMLYVDPWTDRVFTNHLYVACSYMSWSDDQGDSWITNYAACGNTAIDHQKVAVGAHFAPSPVFDGIVYFSYNSFALLVPNGAHQVVSRSLDGGVTWTPSVAVAEAVDFDYRTGGPIAADRAGNVYVPMYTRDGGLGVAVSNDDGVTWNAVQAATGDGLGGEGIDPGLAIDMQGNAYGAYLGYDGAYVTASTDNGRSWGEPVMVSPPGLESFVLGDATAGDAGRVAFAYLATADTDNGPNRADAWARWHLYVSFTEDALAEEPVWETVRVTPEDDPVQVGSICTGGIGCFGGNRNLLDFIDIQPGPDGRIYIAYTDGCLDGCETPQESRSRQGIVAISQDGFRLFEDRAPWAA